LKHFSLLTSVLVLIVGIWAIVEFRQRSRRFPKSGLGGLGLFLLFYNVLIVVTFIGAYGQSNLTATQLEPFAFWYRIVEMPVLAVLVLVAHVSLYAFIFRRRNKSMPSWLVSAAAAFAVAVVAWYYLAQRFPALAPPRPENTFWLSLVWPPGIFDMFWLVVLLVGSRKDADPGRRKVNAAFAWLFLVRYPVHFALSVWNPEHGLFWGITLTRLLGLYTNIVPVYWLKTCFLPWAGGLGKVLGDRCDLAALGKSRGLSAREMEIMELMIDGKSYKEIESALHISIHTVKSHVYSLYRKMDVTSRHQLIHRIGIYGSAESEKRSF